MNVMCLLGFLSGSPFLMLSQRLMTYSYVTFENPKEGSGSDAALGSEAGWFVKHKNKPFPLFHYTINGWYPTAWLLNVAYMYGIIKWKLNLVVDAITPREPQERIAVSPSLKPDV